VRSGAFVIHRNASFVRWMDGRPIRMVRKRGFGQGVHFRPHTPWRHHHTALPDCMRERSLAFRSFSSAHSG
jgi:hypothetical protein